MLLVYTILNMQNSNRDALKEVLNVAGSRYKMHEPKSWPAQAELTAKGAWDELSKLHNEIMNNSQNSFQEFQENSKYLTIVIYKGFNA